MNPIRFTPIIYKIPGTYLVIDKKTKTVTVAKIHSGGSHGELLYWDENGRHSPLSVEERESMLYSLPIGKVNKINEICYEVEFSFDHLGETINVV